MWFQIGKRIVAWNSYEWQASNLIDRDETLYTQCRVSVDGCNDEVTYHIPTRPRDFVFRRVSGWKNYSRWYTTVTLYPVRKLERGVCVSEGHYNMMRCTVAISQTPRWQFQYRIWQLPH